MAIAASVYARELLRGVGLPLAAAVGEDAGVSDALNAIERFKELAGPSLLEKLDKAFNEALKDEIHRALNTSRLEHEFPMLAEKFWARIALPLVELSSTIHVLGGGALEKLREVEEELARAVARMIRSSGYRYADNLIYALSVLVDRDLWVLDKVSKLGLDNLAKKLAERALDTAIQLSAYTMHLTFAWIASTAAVLGIAKDYQERNRDTLAIWCQEYAREVDGYLDTLNLLLDDEVYEDLTRLNIIKR